MNCSHLTDEQLQAHYEAVLTSYRDMAKRFSYDESVTPGDLQTARRELRAAQFELLVRAQTKGAVA